MLRLLQSIWQKMCSSSRTPTMITGSWRASGCRNWPIEWCATNQVPVP